MAGEKVGFNKKAGPSSPGDIFKLCGLKNSKGLGDVFPDGPQTLISLKCHGTWLRAGGFNVTTDFACFPHHAVLIIIPDFPSNYTTVEKNTSLDKTRIFRSLNALVNCTEGEKHSLRREGALTSRTLTPALSTGLQNPNVLHFQQFHASQLKPENPKDE